MIHVVAAYYLEGEEKKSALMFLSLGAIFWARVLQSVKISCLLLLSFKMRIFNNKQLI